MVLLSFRRRVLRLVQLRLEELPQVGRTFHAGKVAFENDFGDPQCRGDLRLKNIALRWIKHPAADFLLGYLIGHGLSGRDEHLVGNARGASGVNSQTDGRE